MAYDCTRLVRNLESAEPRLQFVRSEHRSDPHHRKRHEQAALPFAP